MVEGAHKDVSSRNGSRLMLAKLLIVLLSFHNNHRLTALYMETFRRKGITNSAVSIEIAIVPEIYTLLGIRSSGGH